MNIDRFQESDRDSCARIWKETGWIDPENEHQREGFNALTDAGRAWVSRINGEAECMVLSASGTLRYQTEELPFSGIMGVTTSHVARKQGLAGRLTAHAIAHDVTEHGARVSGLGMFEQGFYDKLGFGSGHYDDFISFDPQALTVPYAKRPPVRLASEDFEEMHASRLGGVREHGYVRFDSPLVTKSDQCTTKKGFGLGFRDGSNGELTHHIWFMVMGGENGPYKATWMSYQNREQFIELMGLMRNLGDQVRLISMIEPPSIQLQDLLSSPLQTRMTTAGSKFASKSLSTAWWQDRINDLPACLLQTHLQCETFQFNLTLTDPISAYLDDTATWQGTGGEYIVTLGEESSAVRGNDASLPTLTSTVNAFTRMWKGSRPATGLSYTASLSAAPELLTQLDIAFRLPKPGKDWEY